MRLWPRSLSHAPNLLPRTNAAALVAGPAGGAVHTAISCKQKPGALSADLHRIKLRFNCQLGMCQVRIPRLPKAERTGASADTPYRDPGKGSGLGPDGDRHHKLCACHSLCRASPRCCAPCDIPPATPWRRLGRSFSGFRGVSSVEEVLFIPTGFAAWDRGDVAWD